MAVAHLRRGSIASPGRQSKVDWIHISRDAEAIVINVPTGTAGSLSAGFGGAAAIELPPGGEHRVELRVNSTNSSAAWSSATPQAAAARHQQLEVYKAQHRGKLASRTVWSAF